MTQSARAKNGTWGERSRPKVYEGPSAYRISASTLSAGEARHLGNYVAGATEPAERHCTNGQTATTARAKVWKQGRDKRIPNETHRKSWPAIDKGTRVRLYRSPGPALRLRSQRSLFSLYNTLPHSLACFVSLISPRRLTPRRRAVVTREPLYEANVAI